VPAQISLSALQFQLHHPQISQRAIEDEMRLAKTRRRPWERLLCAASRQHAWLLIGRIQRKTGEIVLKCAGRWLIGRRDGGRQSRWRRRIVLGAQGIRGEGKHQCDSGCNERISFHIGHFLCFELNNQINSGKARKFRCHPLRMTRELSETIVKINELRTEPRRDANPSHRWGETLSSPDMAIAPPERFFLTG